MNIAKWLPKQNNDMNKIFTHTRNIERELRILGKKFATNINYKNPDYYVSLSLAVSIFGRSQNWASKLKINHSSRLGLSGYSRSGQYAAGGKLTYAIQALSDGPFIS